MGKRKLILWRRERDSNPRRNYILNGFQSRSGIPPEHVMGSRGRARTRDNGTKIHCLTTWRLGCMVGEVRIEPTASSSQNWCATPALLPEFRYSNYVPHLCSKDEGQGRHKSCPWVIHRDLANLRPFRSAGSHGGHDEPPNGFLSFRLCLLPRC